mmetsp:Transcript_43085/g.128696  ORF Transcript_43085/g.128696 Transcript_43085/m.128696 type:complete len:357 (-) Transcript_43085:313-1383(-)
MQGLDSLSLLCASLLIRGKFRVAPALVLRLLIRLLHEAHEEVLDHLLDPREGVVRHAPRQGRQHPAPQLPGADLQVLGRPRLDDVVRLRAERGQRCPLLDHGGEILLGVARDRRAREDLDSLLDRDNLLGTQLLPLLEVRRFLFTGGRQVVVVLLIGGAGRGRVRQVAFGIRLGLQLLGLHLRLLTPVLRGLIDLRREVLHEHLERVLRVHLLLLQGRPLVDKLVEELLEDLDDAVGLELVSGRLGRGHSQPVLRVLRQEQLDGMLGLLGNEAQLLEGGDLREGRLLPVVGLLLQNSNGTLQGVNGLRIVLVHGIVVCLLDIAHLGRRLLIPGPDSDVLLVTCNLLCQRGGIHRRL